MRPVSDLFTSGAESLLPVVKNAANASIQSEGLGVFAEDGLRGQSHQRGRHPALLTHDKPVIHSWLAPAAYLLILKKIVHIKSIFSFDHKINRTAQFVRQNRHGFAFAVFAG